MEGTLIGDYRIERQLGRGGFGVVYIGVDTRLGRRAAIKQLLPELSNNREIVERFFNEAKAAASINHAGIVEIYDVGWHTDGSAYFAMKLLDGDSLAKRLRQTGPLPIQLAATIARQVSSALLAAHTRGIVHRDLKPDNIILVPDDEVAIGQRATILDFGIAKLFGGESPHKTRTGIVMGTPHYMSPEQCRGAREVDHRTDIYALGCILFEMLAGRPPFLGEGAGEIVGLHQFVEPPLLRSLRVDSPPELEAIVSRSLAKHPDHRFAQMAELQAALQPFAAVGGRSQPMPISGNAPTVPPRPIDRGAPTAISARDVVHFAAQSGEHTHPPIAPQTTLSSAGGQLEPAKKKPRAALFAIGGVAAVGATIAIVVAASSSTSTNTPNTTQIRSVTLDAPAVAAAIDATPVTVGPTDELAMKELDAAGAKGDFEGVIVAYAKIPTSSGLYQLATGQLHRYGAEWETTLHHQANAHAGAGACKKIAALLETVRALERKYPASPTHVRLAITNLSGISCRAVATRPPVDTTKRAETPKPPSQPTGTPKSLSPAALKTGLVAIQAAALACYDGVTAGRATVTITIAASGQVTKVAVGSPFTGTPVAACLQTAIKGATFPAWEGASQTFGYSYLLGQ